MEDPVRVQEDEGLQDLVRETLRLLWRQGGALLLHVLLKVILEVLEHQVQLLLREEHFLELDDVWMLQVLQERNLADGGARHSIIFFF